MTAWEWLKTGSSLPSGDAWSLLTHPVSGGSSLPAQSIHARVYGLVDAMAKYDIRATILSEEEAKIYNKTKVVL